MKNPKVRVLFLFLMISFLGIINMYSVSKSFGSELFLRHVSFFIFSLLFLFVFSRIKIPEWKELSYLFFIFAVFLLLLVLVKEKGVKRWIHINGFSFQASEVAKLFLIYFYAMMWKEIRKGYLNSFFLLFLHLIPFVLIMVEPDLGSAGFYIFLYGVFLIFSNFEFKIKLLYVFLFFSLVFSFNLYLFLFFSVSSILFVIFYKKFMIFDKFLLISSIMLPGLIVPFIFNNVLKDYQRKRIVYFLDPSKDPKGTGWQLLQGRLAIGSGGLFGKGFLKGTHKSLAFLPEAHSDFAFASFAEEFGFVGSFILLSLYFLLLRELFNLSISASGFSSYLILGVFSSIFYSFFTNIGSVLGILPLTGIPLTFFSYGGTNLVIHGALLGSVLSVKK